MNNVYGIFGGSKEDMRELPEDQSLWPQEIMDALLAAAPYLNQYNLKTNLLFTDDDTKSGFGYIAVSVNQSPVFVIPIVIRDNKLAPLDVIFVDNESYPLNPETVNKIITTKSEIGEVTRKPQPTNNTLVPTGYTDMKKASYNDIVRKIAKDLVDAAKKVNINDSFIYKVADQKIAREISRILNRDFVLNKRANDYLGEAVKINHIVNYGGRIEDGVWLFKKAGNSILSKEASQKVFTSSNADDYFRTVILEKMASTTVDDVKIVDTRPDFVQKYSAEYNIDSLEFENTDMPGIYYTTKRTGYGIYDIKRFEIVRIVILGKDHLISGEPTKVDVAVIPGIVDRGPGIIESLNGFPVIKGIKPLSSENFLKITNVWDFIKPDSDDRGGWINRRKSYEIIGLVNKGKFTRIGNCTIESSDKYVELYDKDKNIRLVWVKASDIASPVKIRKGIEYLPDKKSDGNVWLMPNSTKIVSVGELAVTIPITDIGSKPSTINVANINEKVALDLSTLGIKNDNSLIDRAEAVAQLVKVGFSIDDAVKVINKPGEWIVSINEKSANENNAEPVKFPVETMLRTALSIADRFPEVGKLIFALTYLSPKNVNQFNKALDSIRNALNVLCKFLVLSRIGQLTVDVNALKGAIEYLSRFLNGIDAITTEQLIPQYQEPDETRS